jgi:hypothetical protein
MADTLKKRYYYKIYTPNQAYVTTWTKEVISDPTFRSVINAGAGQLLVKLARPYSNFGEGFDVALQNRVELWVADSDNLANNANPNTLWNTGIWDMDLWDSAIQSFVKIFSGYISQYAPTLDGENQYIDITVLGYAAETSYRILKDNSGNTTVTYTNQDPGAIMKDVLDKYRADGGTNLSYLGAGIQMTGYNVTYTFTANTLQECFNKLIQLCPDGWFWFVNALGQVFLQPTSTTPDHILTIGKDLGYFQAIKRLENMVNQVFVIGGGTPNLYNEYSRVSSIAAYGKFEAKIQDGKVTDIPTSDYFAKRSLDHNQNPETRTILHISDNQGEGSEGQNIESYNIGDTIQIKNLNYGASGLTLWDKGVFDVDVYDFTIQYTTAAILVIQSIVYYPDSIEIEASSRLPEISKRVEDVNTALVVQLNQNLPAAPTVRSV